MGLAGLLDFSMKVVYYICGRRGSRDLASNGCPVFGGNRACQSLPKRSGSMKDFNEGYSEESLFKMSVPTIKKESIHYLYFLFNKDRVVYVGQTMDPNTRLACHQIDKHFDRYVSFPVDVSMADEEETFYILKFAPKYNKMLSSHTEYQTTRQLKESLGINGCAVKRLIRDKSPRHRLVGGQLYLSVDDLT